MNIVSLVRFPLALLLATIFTSLLFLKLFELIAPMEYVPPIRSKIIDFKTVRPDSDVVPKAREPKPVLEVSQGGVIGIETVRPPAERPVLDNSSVLRGEGGIGKIGRQELPSIPAGSDADVAPILRINPDYPAAAAARGIEGWVKLRFTINASGAISDVSVIDSMPLKVFDKAAADAVARWRYNPMIRDGLAVERRGMEIVLRFTLENK